MKKLTKQQKFDLEMVYKPMYEKNFSKFHTDDYEKNLRTICQVITIVFKDNEDGLFNFLANYEDNIDWYEMINTSNICFHPYFPEIIDIFNDHFKTNSWKFISKSTILTENNNLLEKYKDKFDWDYVSKFKRFSLLDLKQFKDYINFNIYFRGNLHLNSDIIDFIKKSLEGVE